jgi:hypothetical protein
LQLQRRRTLDAGVVAPTLGSLPQACVSSKKEPFMSPLAVSAIIFCVLFASALIGVAIRRGLPERYRNEDTASIVKTAVGLIGTLAALVLGLVVATAKSSYDEKAGQIRQLTAKVIQLDAVLAAYGPEAQKVRGLLRQANSEVVRRVWQGEAVGKSAFQASGPSIALHNEIEALQPGNDLQRALKSRATQTFADIMQERLLLFARSGSTVPTPFLVVVIFWLSVIFASFTVLSQSNGFSVAAIGVAAVSMSGAIYLILELEYPFTGFLQIPSTLLSSALPDL